MSKISKISIMDIINTPFFKHLFFDSYVLKEDGYFPEISCEVFSKYLKDQDFSPVNFLGR